jgi:thiol-disulfide isomerase/thioredoxin
MIKRHTSWLLFRAAVLVLVVLAACSPTAGNQNQSEATAADEVAPEERAPDFELELYQGESVVGGETVQFSDLLGEGKPVVLNFWAGLCPPCRREMPDFQRLYNNRQDEILLVGVDVGTFTGLGTREDGLELLQELEITYPNGTTDRSDILEAYQVLGMPSTYFITPQGEIVQSWAGLLNEEKMSELVDELLVASQQ